MEPWYKVITPIKEVREGRSFNPDEFAIALEQVVACTAPEGSNLGFYGHIFSYIFPHNHQKGRPLRISVENSWPL
jgi:hypothetical protein